MPEKDLVRITEAVVAEIAAEGRVVLVGRAAPVVLARERNAIHVKLVASRGFRIKAAAERLSLDPKEAERVVQETDAQRQRYHREFYGRDWNDAVNYDMILNTERLGFDGATATLVSEARRRGWISRS